MSTCRRSPVVRLGLRANLGQFSLLVGVNQGLCWSTTVIMKIDLAGPKRRGLAMGLNEAAGYGAVALTAYLTGLVVATPGYGPSRSSSASPTRASGSACPP